MADDPWAVVHSEPIAAPVQAAEAWAPTKTEPAPEQPSYWRDAAKGAGTGLVEGAGMVLGFPTDVWRMMDKGYQWAVTKSAEKMGLLTPEQAERLRAPVAGLEDYGATSEAINRRLFDAGKTVGIERYEPQTTPGKFAETAASFIPGAVAFGATGARDAASAAMKYGVLPGVTSEAAGQATHDGPYEPYARVAGAVAGMAPAIALDVARSPTIALRHAVKGVSEPQFSAAQDLMRQSRAAGVPVTLPEAIQQVTKGSTRLGDVMRVVEQSEAGAPITRPFFAERPEQVEGLVRREARAISPTTAEPAETVHRAQVAAEGNMAAADAARSAAVNPSYVAAAADRVPAAEMEGLLSRIDRMIAADKTDLVAPVLEQLRGSLIESPGRAAIPASRIPTQTPTGQSIFQHVAGQPAVSRTPITDIENLDRARKYFRDQMKLPQWAEKAIPKEENAKIGSLLGDLRQMMVDASPDFKAGKALYQDITAKVNAPLARSPAGEMAEAKTLERQMGVLFKPNPAPGSEGAIGNAVRIIAKADPEAAQQLVRLHIERTFNEAAQSLMSGPNQWGGAKFSAILKGNPQQAKNLEAALTALPNGTIRANAMKNTLRILDATGTRQHVGSQTEFNRLMTEGLRQENRLIEGASHISSPWSLGRFLLKVREDFRYGRNTEQFARLFTEGSVAELRAIASASPKTTGAKRALVGALIPRLWSADAPPANATSP